MPKRSNRRGYQFGDSGTLIIKWVGDPPTKVFGPYVSRKKYNFASKPERHVDYRDLPCLIEEAGRENFEKVGDGVPRKDGVEFDNPFEKLEKQPERKAKPKAKTQEVKDAG